MASVQLDPADPGDRRIMTLQQKAARQAGRDGHDREATTRGRADLQAAFDEGAAEPGQDDEAAPGPSWGRSAKRRVGAVGRGLNRGRKAANRAGAPLSKGSWTPSVRPPVRARDAGGLLTGMLLYTAVVTYLRYGPEGWKGWLSAKFLNKPMSGLPASGIDQGGTTTNGQGVHAT